MLGTSANPRLNDFHKFQDQVRMEVLSIGVYNQPPVTEKCIRVSITLSITDQFENVLVSESGLISRYFHPNAHPDGINDLYFVLFFFFLSGSHK